MRNQQAPAETAAPAAPEAAEKAAETPAAAPEDDVTAVGPGGRSGQNRLEFEACGRWSMKNILEVHHSSFFWKGMSPLAVWRMVGQ